MNTATMSHIRGRIKVSVDDNLGKTGETNRIGFHVEDEDCGDIWIFMSQINFIALKNEILAADEKMFGRK